MRRRWTTIVTLVVALGVVAATSPEEEDPIAGEAALQGLEVTAGAPGVEVDVDLGLDPATQWRRVQGLVALEGIVGTSVVEVSTADGAIAGAGAVAENFDLDVNLELRCHEVDCLAPLTVRVRPVVAGTEAVVAGRLSVEAGAEASTSRDLTVVVGESAVVDPGPLTWSTVTIDPDHPVAGQRVEVPDAACAEGATWVVVAPHTPRAGEGPADDPATLPAIRLLVDADDRAVPAGAAAPLQCGGDDGDVRSAWVVLAAPVDGEVTVDWALLGEVGAEAVVAPSTVTTTTTGTVAVGAELSRLAPVAVTLGRAGLVLADPVADDDPDERVRVGSADPSLGGQGPVGPAPGDPDATFGSAYVAPVLWPCEGSCPAAVDLWLRRPDVDDVVDAHAVVYSLAVG